jgi:hypothetical protein
MAVPLDRQAVSGASNSPDPFAGPRAIGSQARRCYPHVIAYRHTGYESIADYCADASKGISPQRRRYPTCVARRSTLLGRREKKKRTG